MAETFVGCLNVIVLLVSFSPWPFLLIALIVLFLFSGKVFGVTKLGTGIFSIQDLVTTLFELLNLLSDSLVFSVNSR